MSGIDTLTTVYGTDDDDRMIDRKGANTKFVAGKGDDRIQAGDGDDVLIGGEGNDVLIGGNGKDRYEFSKGHGQDLITEYLTTNDVDTIAFSDVKFEEVKFRRENYDLVLFGYNGSDSVTIKAFFANKANQLEVYEFADRTLTLEQLKAESIPFVGTVDSETMHGWIYGEGASTFVGKQGDDVFNGRWGSDAYVIGKISGSDVINENAKADSNDVDTIKFTDIASLDELRFSRKGNNLVIEKVANTDKVTVNNWFAGKGYQVEQIQLSDDSIITNTQVNEMIQAMASFGAKSAGGVSIAPKEDTKIFVDNLSVGI